MFDTNGRYTCGDCNKHNLYAAGSIGGAIRDVNKYIDHHAKNRYSGAAAPQQASRSLSVNAPNPALSMMQSKPLTHIENQEKCLADITQQIPLMKNNIAELKQAEALKKKQDAEIMRIEEAQASVEREYSQRAVKLENEKQVQLQKIGNTMRAIPVSIGLASRAPEIAVALSNIAQNITNTSLRGGQHDPAYGSLGSSRLPLPKHMYSPPGSVLPLFSSITADTKRLVEEARRMTQAGIRTDSHVGAPTLKVDREYGLDLPYKFPGYYPSASTHPTVFAANSSHVGSHKGISHSSDNANPRPHSVSGFIEPRDRSGFLSDEARDYENPNGFFASKSAHSQNSKGEHIFNMTP